MRTQNYNLILLSQNQAAKEVIVNENFIILEAFANKAAEDIVEVLPLETRNGAIFICGDQLALRHNDRWRMILAVEGMIFYIKSKKKFLIFSLGTWEEV